MRLRTMLRISPGAWLVPVMLGLMVFYVSESITFAHREPYVLGLTARAMNMLGLVIPVFAAGAAWEGGRWSRAGIWGFPIARSRLVVAAWSIAPAFLGSAIVVVAAAVQVLAYEGLLLPDPLVLGLALALLAAHTVAGFAAGTAWPRVIAVPVVVLVSFASFVMPRVLEPGWLLHPFGTSLELCCNVEEVLAPEAAASILVLSGGILVAAMLRIVQRRATWPGRAASLATLSAAFVIAAAIASPVPRSPITDRLGEAEHCVDGAEVRLCAWPEHVDELSVVLSAADETVRAWSRFGLDMPSVFTEAVQTRIPDARTVDMWVDQRPRDFRQALSRAMVPGAPECAETERWPSQVAEPYLWIWFAITAGVPPDEIRRYEGDERPEIEEYPDARPASLLPVRPLVDDILASPRNTQRRWVAANLDAMGECSVVPPLLPR